MWNENLLQPDVQEFINQNLKEDPSWLILKGSPFSSVSIKEIVGQIQSKRKAVKKLPDWYKNPKVIFPPKENLSQASSAITANYKQEIIKNFPPPSKIIDITGGMGVDAIAFAEIAEVWHCEESRELSALSQYNLNQFSTSHPIVFRETDGIKFLAESREDFDWVYADPSRRTTEGKRVFQLKDCFPKILPSLDLILSKTKYFLLKTSPLLDISQGLKQLKHVVEIHIIAVRQEVKELLWVLQKKQPHISDIRVKTVHYTSHSIQKFDAFWRKGGGEKNNYGPVQNYLYEPNPAVQKSQLFGALGREFGLKKMAPHTHLFTSDRLTDFPGRKFKIEQVEKFQKKKLKKPTFKKAHISTRNFPMSVQEIRRLSRIKEGGDIYLFFITNAEGKRLMLTTKKQKPRKIPGG